MIFTEIKNLVSSKHDNKTFGKNNQIKVIGKDLNSGLCVVECSVCKLDHELFMEGLFTSSITDLNRGQIPCGCSNPVYTEQQQKVRVKRLADKIGVLFLGWSGEFIKNSTYCKLSCHEHGVWTTTTISRLVKTNSGCPECGKLKAPLANTKSDLEMVCRFFSSGVFDLNTSFTRSNRLTNKGYKEYWLVHCPNCDTINESLSYHLGSGKLPCECSSHSQTQAYINSIMNEGEIIALKFGIARVSHKRLEKQNKYSLYEVKSYGVWRFPDVRACKDSEKFVKSSIKTSYLNKEVFSDGYTETTSPDNLQNIIDIFESFGGFKLTII